MIRKSSLLLTAMASVVLLAGNSVHLRADDGKGGGDNNDKGQAQTRLKTDLAGGAITGVKPEGSADFRFDSKSRTKLNVEVEHVNLAAKSVLTVSTMQGTVATRIGTITLNALGEGELELDSQDGDTVPAVVKGTMIVVSNGATPILTGTF